MRTGSGNVHSIRSSEDTHATMALKLFSYQGLRHDSIHSVIRSARVDGKTRADVYCVWTMRYWARLFII